MATATLRILINGEDNASGAIGQSQSAVERLSSVATGALGGIGTAGIAAFAAVTAAAVGAAGASLAAFVPFERGMAEVFTLIPGASAEMRQSITEDALAAAQAMGRLPNEVIPALYQALSAGVPPDNVFDFLEIANAAAVGGVTDLETAVDGITSVVNAYGSSVINATQASDLMFNAVRLGKTTFEELSANLSNVIPTAASLGIGFDQVTAAIAALTAQGAPTNVVTTQMRALFGELATESSELGQAIESVTGQSFTQFIEGGGDMQGAMAALQQYAADNNVEFRSLFSSVEALGAALGLTGPGAALFANALEAMGESAGSTQAAFDTMNTTISRLMERMRAVVGVAMIRIGSALAPLITQLAEFGEGFVGTFVDKMLPSITTFLDGFVSLASTGLGDAMQVFNIFIKDLTGGTFTLSGALKNLAANVLGQDAVMPFLALIDGFSALGAGLNDVGTAFAAGFAPFAATLAEVTGQNAGQSILNIAQALTSLGEILTTVAPVIGPAFATLTAVIGASLGGLITIVTGAVAAIAQLLTGDFAGAITTAQTALSTALNGILALFGKSLEDVRMSLLMLGAIVLGGLLIVSNYFREQFAKIGATIQNAMSAAVKTVGTALGQMLETAIAFVPDFVGAGGDIAMGILVGLQNNAGALLAYLGSLIKNMINAILGGMDISSPSGVGIYAGQMLMEGLAVGMEGMRREVIGTAESLALAVGRAATPSLGGLNGLSPSAGLAVAGVRPSSLGQGGRGGSVITIQNLHLPGVRDGRNFTEELHREQVLRS